MRTRPRQLQKNKQTEQDPVVRSIIRGLSRPLHTLSSMSDSSVMDHHHETEEIFQWEDQDCMCGMSGRFINEMRSPLSDTDDPIEVSTGKRARDTPTEKRTDAHGRGRDSRIRDDEGDNIFFADVPDTILQTITDLHSSSCLANTLESTMSMELLPKQLNAVNGDLCAAVKRGDVGAYKDAVARGADLSTSTTDGLPLLHMAVLNESQEITRLMLRAGVGVELTDRFKKTALHVAAEGGSNEAVKLLLTFGSSVNASDDRGYAPVVNAVMRGKVANAASLLEAGAEQSICLQLMIKYGTAEDLMDLFTKAKMTLDLAQENGDGLTPLMQAASWGDGMEGTEKIHIILDAGGMVDQASSVTKSTALHVACHHGHERNVYHLLARGASVHTRDSRGLLPLDVARSNTGWGWRCEKYVNAVQEAHSTGVQDGVDLYTGVTEKMWQIPFELRRIHFPKHTEEAILTWAYGAIKDAVACYTFLGGKGSPANERIILFWGGERRHPGCIREVGSGMKIRMYVGCMAAYLVHTRNVRMNIADVLTQVYQF